MKTVSILRFFETREQRRTFGNEKETGTKESRQAYMPYKEYIFLRVTISNLKIKLNTIITRKNREFFFFLRFMMSNFTFFKKYLSFFLRVMIRPNN